MSTNFSPNSAELALVNQIFIKADPAKIGALTGENAVQIFNGAKLQPTVLGEIWNIADEDDKGQLSRRGVAIAVRLIGWAQKGEKVTQALVNKPGPLAVIEGINNISQQNTGISLPKSPPPLPFPPLTQQDKTKFQNLFLKANPVNGLLSAEKARDIFVKSKLPTDQLMKIWNLADTQDRGSLDVVDFAIGMYFIQAVMAGKIPLIPTALPPGLYQQAGGVPSPTLRSQITGTSGSFSPVGNIFPQHTGPQLQPQSTGSFKPPLPARPQLRNGSNQDWDISPTEKASSDRYFDTLDTSKRGYIEGEVAVPFMLGSKLPEEDLARIWDLADIHNNGLLTRDGFAIAMNLIQKKLAGQEIPATLPPSLIPPSLRTVTASPFSPANNVQQHHQPEIHQDLLGWDDSPPPSAINPQVTGVLKPQTTGATLASAPVALPFAPASDRRHVTDPFASSPFAPVHHSPDLLSDDSHEASPPLEDRSAEIGNFKNQIQSTNKSLAAVQEERLAMEQIVANQASQLSSMQTQLSSAKAAYESESKLLENLKERRAGQIADMQKTREELIRAESDLSAIRVEKTEIEGALLRDKEEARDLHKRMIEAGQQAEALKVDVEKVRKEAKQQKGLLAIARKQLSTKESERAKAEKEHEEATEELNSVLDEKAGVEAEIASLAAAASVASSPSPPKAVVERAKSPVDSLAFAAAQPLPITPDVGVSSPSGKSNNPFERFAKATGASPSLTSSPFLATQDTGNGSLVDDIFFPVDVPSIASPSESQGHLKQDTELSYFDTPASSHGHDDDDSEASPTTANGTEHFMTPPTSAVALSDPTERFPSLDEISVSIAPKSTSAPGEATQSADHDVDLNAPLKELELDDSDSDDSDDEKPLAEVQSELAKSPSHAPETKAVGPSTSSFDDIFGSNGQVTAPPAASNGVTPRLDLPAFGPSVAANGNGTNEVTVAGVDAFDETMGKIAKSSPAPVTLAFDGFEDTFDFASVTKASGVTSHTDGKAEPAVNNTFDDIFASNGTSANQPAVNTVVTPTVTTTSPQQIPPAVQFDSSFDEVFASFDKDSTLPVLQAPSSSAGPSSSPAVVPKTEEPAVPGAFPTPSQPSSPKSSTIASPPRSEIKPSALPGGPHSPPPRTASPKPRLSSSSSKDHHDKPKDPPRSSKISLRLPFSRKKKHQEPVPPPPANLPPPMEETRRIRTPTGDEDVEPVKQLIAMGFTRGQAIDALEKYSYDVQKALNSLLGTP